MRAYCSACQYPQKMCLCAHLTHIENKTPILVLQHPKESKHPLNTIHIAKRCLEKIEVRHTPIDNDTCHKWTRDAALLFPTHQSVPLPSNHTGPLLFLDATWPKAQGMRLSIPSLRSKICYHIPNPPKGEYTIRKATNPNALSSIEAIAAALEHIERTPNKYTPLRVAFRARIQMQIQHIDPIVFGQNYSTKS